MRVIGGEVKGQRKGGGWREKEREKGVLAMEIRWDLGTCLEQNFRSQKGKNLRSEDLHFKPNRGIEYCLNGHWTMAYNHCRESPLNLGTFLLP